MRLTFKPEVKVKASVSPTCVGPGNKITLTVDVGPNSAIGFQAIYADNKSGAKAPAGAGYGGNDSGTTKGGHYVASWVVALNTPEGPARVDVYAAVSGAAWGYAGVPFSVRRGSC